MTNYYQLLGVSDNASEAEIKAAFKRKALQYHPDKNSGDVHMEEMFKQINTAYQVLSNPYERARYDLKLRFGDVEVSSPPPRAYRRYERPHYAPKPIDHRTNDLATMWAFGISLGIALVVMLGIQGFNLYTEHKREVMLGERRVVFEKARDHHNIGQVASCLSLLETLGTFHKEEEDIIEFHDHVLDELLQKGTQSFYQKQYEQALSYFEVFDDYAPVKRLSFELLIADTHKNVGNFDEAIRRFNKLIIEGNNTIENNLKLASIYREGKGDYQEAMKYYDIASDMAIASYESLYGRAYPLILSPNNIPAYHFEIYHGMAQTFFDLGRDERALSAIKWNIIMWPDHPENYVLKGQILEAQGKQDQACGQYKLAEEKGWPEDISC